jgi:hypothetical protein
MFGYYRKETNFNMYLDDVSTIVLPFTEEKTPMKKKICTVTQPKFRTDANGFLD